MSNLDNLIEWMGEYKQLYAHSEDCMKMSETIKAKALQLQKEEPKTYTQEEYDKGCRDVYERAIKNYGLAEVGVKNNPPKTV
jgi:hypothetical protein